MAPECGPGAILFSSTLVDGRLHRDGANLGRMYERSPFYGSAVWKKTRRIVKLQAGHQCAHCGRVVLEPGEMDVHHRKALKKAPALATEPLNLEPLCRACHRRLEHAQRRGPMAAIDGSPTSPDHPWNRLTGREVAES